MTPTVQALTRRGLKASCPESLLVQYMVYVFIDIHPPDVFGSRSALFAGEVGESIQFGLPVHLTASAAPVRFTPGKSQGMGSLRACHVKCHDYSTSRGRTNGSFQAVGECMGEYLVPYHWSDTRSTKCNLSKCSRSAVEKKKKKQSHRKPRKPVYRKVLQCDHDTDRGLDHC
jgi:hypothetical protein